MTKPTISPFINNQPQSPLNDTFASINKMYHKGLIFFHPVLLCSLLEKDPLFVHRFMFFFWDIQSCKKAVTFFSSLSLAQFLMKIRFVWHPCGTWLLLLTKKGDIIYSFASKPLPATIKKNSFFALTKTYLSFCLFEFVFFLLCFSVRNLVCGFW